jgi:hypothetical protein
MTLASGWDSLCSDGGHKDDSGRAQHDDRPRWQWSGQPGSPPLSRNPICCRIAGVRATPSMYCSTVSTSHGAKRPDRKKRGFPSLIILYTT